jgi:putative transposase
LIERGHPFLSVARQATLLSISRSSVYYTPYRSPRDIRLTRLMDEMYLEFPCYGVRRMQAALARCGEEVGKDHVRTLMRQMGLVALGPKPGSSQPHPEHKVYPYLLRGLRIERSNQVWCTDITYIRMRQGWLYLVAIMDWFSRYVLSWKLSITLEVEFCLEALHMALTTAKPEIFNSDQGAQFTSLAFTQRLKSAGIAISMDGRGRVFDNIFIERLWRSLKQEEVYVHDYDSVKLAQIGMNRFFERYNYRRLHQSLNYATPAEIYYAE